MVKGIKNIGILAHVDAGKTTITENFLFLSKAIKKLGNVDQGSSVTDSMSLEKQRGISIRSASASFSWNDYIINLIDTPGHPDFSAEVERSLAVLDGVILVLSAVEGVQSHTLTLWDAIKKSGKPCLIFVNKIDRAGSDFLQVIDQVKKEISPSVFSLTATENEGENNAKPVDVFETNNLNTIQSSVKEKSIEALAELDEEILARYLDGETLSWDDFEDKIILLSQKQEMCPLFCGVAKYGKGIKTLLDGIVKFVPNAQNCIDENFSALVFKLEHDKTLGKLAHIRVFSGSIKNRDILLNNTTGKDEKVAQIKKVYAGSRIDEKEIAAGDIGIITGLQNVRAGDVLGDKNSVPELISLQKPVITIQVKVLQENQYADLGEALYVLNAEDPALAFKWFKEEREMHLNLMGTVQVEVLQSILESRFGVDTEFLKPTVIYKETPVGEAEGYIEYTMPKPCWAVMTFKVEPAELGSGVTYCSEVGVNDIHRKYQNEIEETVPKSLIQGIKGWEVTDIKITLIKGEDHEIHSRPGDFILATPVGIMRALEKSSTNFLEPMYNFEIKSPEEFLGTIASDLNKMRATFESPEFENENVALKGLAPVSTFMDYNIRLSSLTGGRGRLRIQFGGYQLCEDEHGKTRKFKGVNPLNTRQWILHKRGAFKADEQKF